MNKEPSHYSWLESEQSFRSRLEQEGRVRIRPERAHGAVHRTRVYSMMEHYLTTSAGILSRQIEQKTRIRRPLSMLPEEGAGAVSTFASAGFVSLQLRIFQQQALLLLPYELIHDLSAYVLKRRPSPLLSSPTDEEITAVNFTLASLLVEQDEHCRQRIYLTSAKLHCCSKADRDLSVLSAQITKGESLVLSSAVEINSSEYQLLAVLDRGLCSRLAQYAGYWRDKNAERRLAAETSWRLSLRIDLLSFQSFCALSSGGRFPVLSCSRGENGVSSVWMFEQTACRQTTRPARIPVEVLEGSLPGALRLKPKQNFRGE